MTSKPTSLRCSRREHGQITPEGYIRIRCRERSCSDVVAVKGTGRRVWHVWDLQGRLIRTEVEDEKTATIAA